MGIYLSSPLTQAVRKALAGSGAVVALGVSSFVTAGDVKSFGEVNHSNNADPAFTEIRGVNSLNFRVPAGETQVTLSGYVKGTTNFDFDEDLGDSFVVSSIPSDANPASDSDGNFRLHARQSRFRIRSETEAGPRQLKTHFEGDFFGGGGNETFSNSSSFRLRHAYANYGPWTIGQFWTNFMDFVAYPTTVDFFGPAGKSFARQAQIRYTMDNGLSFSIENPETDGFGALGRLREANDNTGKDVLPDFTAAWRGGPGGAGGSYEVAAVARFLGVDGVGVVGSGVEGVRIDDEAFGIGFNAAGGWTFDKLTVSASLTGGDGIGRYIINGAGNDVFVTDDGELETVTSFAGSLNLSYAWTENSSSLISFGTFSNDDEDESNGIESLQTIHLNYIWAPYPNSSFGVELIQGLNDVADSLDDDGNLDDGEGSATRLVFGAQLNF